MHPKIGVGLSQSMVCHGMCYSLYSMLTNWAKHRNGLDFSLGLPSASLHTFGVHHFSHHSDGHLNYRTTSLQDRCWAERTWQEAHWSRLRKAPRSKLATAEVPRASSHAAMLGRTGCLSQLFSSKLHGNESSGRL